MTKLLNELASGAIFDRSKKFRYRLHRTWDASLPTVLFVMLNPSIANATENDATIRRCIGFAKLWGYGGIVVVNLYAYVATQPAKLSTVHLDIIGSQTNHYIKHAAERAGLIVAAWGNGARGDRWQAVTKALRKHRPVHCLGVTKEGQPKHPLRLAYKTKLEIFGAVAQ